MYPIFNTTLLSLCREICLLFHQSHKTFNTFYNKTFNKSIKYGSDKQLKYKNSLHTYTHTQHTTTHIPPPPPPTTHTLTITHTNTHTYMHTPQHIHPPPTTNSHTPAPPIHTHTEAWWEKETRENPDRQRGKGRESTCLALFSGTAATWTPPQS